MILNCLALWQPWASLVAQGFKKIETRGRYLAVRGRIGIHATLDPPGKQSALNAAFFKNTPACEGLRERGYTWESLPRGGIVATVDVYACKAVVLGTIDDERYQMNPPGGEEELMGWYAEGRYGIFMQDVYVFNPLFQAKGKQTLIFPVEIPDSFRSL